MLQKQSRTILVFLDSLMGPPINYMVDFDVATYYDYNLGLHHGICYSMVEVIYNTTSSKAKEYETCCRPLQQDPEEDTKRTVEKRILTTLLLFTLFFSVADLVAEKGV